MKKAIDRLEPFDKKHKCVNVVVETPKGSRVKYSYDPKSGFFILSKALPEGMVFPFNFGFVPQTLADDGDPLDVLVLNEEQLISGCLLHVRPIAKSSRRPRPRMAGRCGTTVSSDKPSARKRRWNSGRLPARRTDYFANRILLCRIQQALRKEVQSAGNGGPEEGHRNRPPRGKIVPQKNKAR